MLVYGQWKRIKIVFIMGKSPKTDAETILFKTTISMLLCNRNKTNAC